jgi:phage baseplate assembly protein W
MALSPFATAEDRITFVDEPEQPSKTYAFDFDRGEFTGAMIDEIEAIKQFIRKTLVTSRYRHLIYDREYGSELETLIGSDVTPELLDSEIPRIVQDALLYDERIDDVYDFEITKEPGSDAVVVAFSVSTADGHELQEEVTL